MHTCTCEPDTALVYGCSCRPLGPAPTGAPPAPANSWTRSPLARWAWNGDATDPDAAARAARECACLHSCAEDPATACSLSGDFHIHPDQPCPVHLEAPGDRRA